MCMGLLQPGWRQHHQATLALLNCETRNSDLALTTNHITPIKVRIQEYHYAIHFAMLAAYER